MRPWCRLVGFLARLSSAGASRGRRKGRIYETAPGGKGGSHRGGADVVIGALLAAGLAVGLASAGPARAEGIRGAEPAAATQQAGKQEQRPGSFVFKPLKLRTRR